MNELRIDWISLLITLVPLVIGMITAYKLLNYRVVQLEKSIAEIKETYTKEETCALMRINCNEKFANINKTLSEIRDDMQRRSRNDS